MAAMDTLSAALSCPCAWSCPRPVVLLSCSHNFCKQCVELALVCQHCAHIDGQFYCPACRKEQLGPSTTEAAGFFFINTLGTLSNERTGDGWPAKRILVARTHTSEGLSGGWGAGLGPRVGACGLM